MKKVLFILFSVLVLLVGCSSYIEDGEFTFDEQEFKKTYEDKSDSSFPENITIGPKELKIEMVTAPELIAFLDTVDHFVGSKELSNLMKSVEEGDYDGPAQIESNDYSMLFIPGGDDTFSLAIHPM